jgi:V/A-type H+/Na+-transporting ATPase subunit D
MAKLNVAPTKSSLLTLKRQRAFAEEGYDLLEQKRQILVFELMSRLERARAAEQAVAEAAGQAFAAVREAVLDMGVAALDRAVLAVRMDHRVDVTDQHMMGLRAPRVTVDVQPPIAQFGVGGTSAHADVALRRFVDLLPRLAELAELETAVLRLARELRKTQRRCNALSKIFIPNYRETIDYITGSLEEREREAFVILRLIRDRLAAR